MKATHYCFFALLLLITLGGCKKDKETLPLPPPPPVQPDPPIIRNYPTWTSSGTTLKIMYSKSLNDLVWRTFSVTNGKVSFVDSISNGISPATPFYLNPVQDTQGRIIRWNDYYYEYNSSGLLSKSIHKVGETPGDRIDRFYIYNLKGQVITDSIKTWTYYLLDKYQYDTNGNIVRMDRSSFYNDGTVYAPPVYGIYRYDQKPNPYTTLTAGHLPDNILRTIYEAPYITPNNVIGVDYFDKNNNLVNKYNFNIKYDSGGNVISHAYFGGGEYYFVYQ